MMNDDAFARLVAEEVKNRVSRSQREYLMLPENWHKWQRALVALSRNLDEQLARLKHDEEDDTRRYEALGKDGVRLLAEAISEYEGRRKKIERFKYHVDNRVDDVTRMIALGPESADDEIKSVEFLRRAISAHKEKMVSNNIEPTAIDRALWSALEGKWEFDDVVVEDL
jgi:hypothetical protein